jgi:hypothetical protein
LDDFDKFDWALVQEDRDLIVWRMEIVHDWFFQSVLFALEHFVPDGFVEFQ